MIDIDGAVDLVGYVSIWLGVGSLLLAFFASPKMYDDDSEDIYQEFLRLERQALEEQGITAQERGDA